MMDMTIIGTKWVFRNKLDENGVVSRNKARLVAQGYNQQEGIDYDKTYAPIARLESIRILLAYACALDFKLFQMDVKSAFLNGFINEEVYVAQPPGFIDFAKPNHVYRLKKALYGLKQAPKAWYDRLKAFLIKHDYTMGMVDNTLFTKKKDPNLIIVQIYVDDIIFGSTCQEMCDDFAKIMHDEFEMSMMGELNFFLGLQIKQLEDDIFFNQSIYIKKMLKKFRLEDSKPMKTPISTETKLTKDVEDNECYSRLYGDEAMILKESLMMLLVSNVMEFGVDVTDNNRICYTFLEREEACSSKDVAHTLVTTETDSLNIDCDQDKKQQMKNTAALEDQGNSTAGKDQSIAAVCLSTASLSDILRTITACFIKISVEFHRCVFLSYLLARGNLFVLKWCDEDLSKSSKDPKTSHLEAVKRIFRYVKGTTHLGLWYPKGSGIETIVYADSDHAGDYVDRKSTSGICTFMGCCLTSWFSKKQTALAISTTEAEYVSTGKACQQALWMKQALVDYGIRLDDIPIMCDNKEALDLSKNPVQYSCTKHIEIRHHFLRDNVQK
ncbi:retrovirus-related pol polyprotein from transposon TNT 1-94 [Tanacetum coccineum]